MAKKIKDQPKKPTNDADVWAPIVERLRKAEAEDAAAEKDNARGYGIEWAKHHGRPRQLARLEVAGGMLANTPVADEAKVFVSIINGRPADWDEAREFFTAHVGEGRHAEWEASGFVEAFAAGALAMWKEMKVRYNAA